MSDSHVGFVLGEDEQTLEKINKVTAFVTYWDRLHHNMILSPLGPLLCPHGFVSGNSQATFQWVTHPGIALAPTRLTSEFP
ncbi:hypothetical protein L3X38_033328 [Prunus dulcis]|uniref:Uncharacterized protein n=1 Tax=Prunus dulcis TaxID=3755 RepID=A0AAD4VFQ3_PRUDU|nr:hypothetical protein L3X38_033328 [Prunus dulcis]